MRLRSRGPVLAGLILLFTLLLTGADVPTATPPFVAFESGPVRPMAMSPDGSKLFVANTPNGTLEVFNITTEGLAPIARIPVGLEPVAVAARSDSEVWVVNMLSDSVSVVSLAGTPRVVRTLAVGDEPRDIVFAGSPSRAFITTAHRGQQRSDASLQGVPGAGDPQLTTPGVGRADVWVFDAAEPAKPLRILSFFADTPRALAVSPDRNTVYVAAFKSGNQTAVVNEPLVCDGFKPKQPCEVAGVKLPGGNPGPATNAEGKPAPETSLIVKFNNTTRRWEDELQRDWNAAVPFRLPDLDVFAIDAQTLTQTAAYPHVGTVLFNMVANPVSGRLYVSNTEALNHLRFEGPGRHAGQTVQGRSVQTRVTVIDGKQVLPRHLNKHIDYSRLAHDPKFDASMREHSLSMPLEMAVTRDGKTLYVAAYGSSRVGVFDTAELESDRFNPRSASARYIDVSGGGPGGVLLDEARGRLYVMTRFDNAVKVIDLTTKVELAAHKLLNPEPASVVAGRPMLYDAKRLSANGEASCGSCHIFGDVDDLAWDLGNPDDKVQHNPIPINLGGQVSPVSGLPFQINGSGHVDELHPMKGPMTTQTLRGLRHSGAMHWRGDRAVGFYGTHATDSELSFKNFIVAFEGLMGAGQLPSATEMRKFSDFQLQVQPPPNPVRRLDNTLTEAQQRGRNFYFGPRPATGTVVPAAVPSPEPLAFTCDGCHRLDPAQGHFGAGGRASFDGGPQTLKIPQLRNLYQKVGLFGSFSLRDPVAAAQVIDEVRGFGILHDGGVGTMLQFFRTAAFLPQPDVGFPMENPDATRRDVEQFVLAYDSDLAPVVGQQVTLTRDNAALAGARIDLLIQRAQTPFTSKALGGAVTECELVAHGVDEGGLRGYVYDPVHRDFVSADGRKRRSDAALRALASSAGQEITYTCTPPGSGRRVALLP